MKRALTMAAGVAAAMCMAWAAMASANPDDLTVGPGARVGQQQSPDMLAGVDQLGTRQPGDRERQMLDEQAAAEPTVAVSAPESDKDTRAQCEGDVDVGVDPFFNSPLFPIYGFYNYSRSMALVLRSELDPGICSPQVISHISVYVGVAGTMNFTGIQLRLKKTTATAISTTWDGSGTLVWSGSRTFNAVGWYDFDITDFNWDSDNLLITWQHGYTAHANYPQFRAKSLGTGVYRQAYGYSDTALPTTLSQTISRTLYRLTFPAVPAACCIGGQCSLLTSSACATAGGVFQGPGTSCTPKPLRSAADRRLLPNGWLVCGDHGSRVRSPGHLALGLADLRSEPVSTPSTDRRLLPARGRHLRGDDRSGLRGTGRLALRLADLHPESMSAAADRCLLPAIGRHVHSDDRVAVRSPGHLARGLADLRSQPLPTAADRRLLPTQWHVRRDDRGAVCCTRRLARRMADV